jgi:hypothetical protein
MSLGLPHFTSFFDRLAPFVLIALPRGALTDVGVPVGLKMGHTVKFVVYGGNMTKNVE